jgi:hypothetical protein
MAGSTLSTTAHVFKKKYSDGQIGEHAQREHPTMKMIRKEGGMSGLGAGWAYMIDIANPQGVGGTYASIVKTGSSGVQMLATRRKRYGIVTLDGEALAASKDNKGAFLSLISRETDGVIEEVGDTLAFGLFGDGTGALGQRSSISGDIVTLTAQNDVRNFKVNMTVVADDTADGSSLRVGDAVVDAIDYDGGTVTLDDETGIAAFANSDYLFRIGDPGTIVDGFAVHLPLTAPVFGSDSFRSVDRGTDVLALSGARVDNTAAPIEQNAGLVAIKIAQGTKKAATRGLVCVLNPINFFTVTQRTGAKVTYDGGGMKATVGFEGIDLATPAGTMRCISDPDCPTNRGYVLNPSTWYWKHLEAFTHFIRDDGGGVTLRMITEDSIKADVRAMGNVVCTLPGANGVFSIA